jgi:hypothetical protein
VDAAVGGELGVEGGGHDVALLDEDGEAVAGGEDLDAVAGFYDTGRADVDHFERAAGELRFAGLDGAVDLTAVGVALDGCMEDAEALLRRVRDVGGEEDTSGAGAEGGFAGDEVLEGGKEAIALEKFENVVDSPPGMMRPSIAASCSGLRMRTGSAPASRRAWAWAS